MVGPRLTRDLVRQQANLVLNTNYLLQSLRYVALTLRLSTSHMRMYVCMFILNQFVYVCVILFIFYSAVRHR